MGKTFLKTLILCGGLLCLSLTAAAQDSAVGFDASSPASETAAAPANLSPSDRDPWQLGAGFQYQHFNVYGLSFHNLGFNSSITRYLNNWFGLEGAAEMGFGHSGTSPQVPVSLVAKSFFVGGGPHLTFTNSGRVEPWVHGLVGWEHLRFTQTGLPLILGSQSALGFQLGGGLDFKLGGLASWRVQGDYVGTRFSSTLQSNYSFGTGLVLNF
jgi:hypothetical protein